MSDDSPISPIEDIIEDARNGRPYILVDAEDRENEGDVIIPAQFATPDQINFMARHARGLICLSITHERARQLRLPPMAAENRESMTTAFTVSIEAKEGVTTGISAHDRAHTVAVAIDPTKGPDDIVSPGHVFPLVARDGGVLVRAGHTEAAIDISRLAGLNPAGVICEIMKDDGTMARLPDLQVFAREHGLKIGTIADLIQHRSRHESLIERVAERRLETAQGAFDVVAYRDRSGAAHLALRVGQWRADDEVLVRVHEPLSVLDLLDTGPCIHSWPLAKALAALTAAGRGVAVLLNCGEASDALIRHLGASREASPPPRGQMDLRTYGVGAQILRDQGVRRMKLLGSPRRMPSLTGSGLEVTGFLTADTDKEPRHAGR